MSETGFIRLDDEEAVKASLDEVRQYREKHDYWKPNKDSKPDSGNAKSTDSTSDSKSCNKVLQQSTAENQDQIQTGDSPSKRKIIVDYLSSDWTHLSAKKISKDTGIKHSTVRSYLRRLQQDGIILRDDDHRYYLSNQLATLTGHRGATAGYAARKSSIYTPDYFSHFQHFDSTGFRLQNIRVVSGELELSNDVSPLSIDIPYGSDCIHLDVNYSLRQNRYNWTVRIASGIHVDDLISLGNYVSSILSNSYIYYPPGRLYDELVEAKWYVRQVEVLHDDYTRRLSGYYEIDTLHGVICKEYGKADCVRRENQVKRLPEDTTIPDLVEAVHGSASQIDSNVRVKLLERQMQHILDTLSQLVSRDTDHRLDVDALNDSIAELKELIHHG